MRKFRVLVVEDCAAHRFAVVAELQRVRNGFVLEILEAETLAKAIELADTCQCVVLDLHLPDSDSPYDTLKSVRDAAPEVPILIHTSDERPEVHLQLGKIQCAGIVAKGDKLGPSLALLLGRADAYCQDLEEYETALRGLMA